MAGMPPLGGTKPKVTQGKGAMSGYFNTGDTNNWQRMSKPYGPDNPAPWTPPGPAPAGQNATMPMSSEAPPQFVRPQATTRSLRIGMVSPGVRGQQQQQGSGQGEGDFMAALQALMQQFGGQG